MSTFINANFPMIVYAPALYVADLIVTLDIPVT